MGLQGDDRTQSRQVGVNTAWTDEQRRVIEATAGSRLLVDAGPGTGKTATACARIAWLIASGGIEASEIWLVSFTRTAVHELRSRIAAHLPDPGQAAALRIATVDSQAWAVQSGFDSQVSHAGTFDDNIQHVIELVRSHEGVFSYLGTVRHLVVDEAQDVVGLRCELLLEIIHALPKSAGISIYSDEAQAIYGFAEEGANANVDGHLPEKIREFLREDFEEIDLNKVHRTQDKALLKVFGNGRALMRDKRLKGSDRLHRVKELVGMSCHGQVGLYRDDIQRMPGDLGESLLLFRRRGEVLDASGYLGLNPHRLRMSGLPTCIHGWISVLLWDWTRPELDQADFERRWKERLGVPATTGAENAWSILVKYFGRTTNRISVTRLVQKLASASPTYELTLPEFGSLGPVIGTIHGSKGREANDVRLYLSSASKDGADESELDEEARIVFVGATRAKKKLHVGQAASKAVARRLEVSGRAFTPYPYKRGQPAARAAVEIGRVNDLDVEGLVGRALYASAVQAVTAQQRIMDLKAYTAGAHAVGTYISQEWRYQILQDGSDEHLCYLSTNVGFDMFRIAKVVDQLVNMNKRRPPNQLNHLKTFGVRTIAMSPDNPARELLHSPWRDSGLIAAPMLIGYPIANFRFGGS